MQDDPKNSNFLGRSHSKDISKKSHHNQPIHMNSFQVPILKHKVHATWVLAYLPLNYHGLDHK